MYTFSIETSAKYDKICYVYTLNVLCCIPSTESKRKRFKKFILLNPQYCTMMTRQIFETAILDDFTNIREDIRKRFAFYIYCIQRHTQKKLFSAHFI